MTVFFLISGFLLYRPFVAARLSGRSPIRLRDYARRRLLRIVPAYWLALTALAIWPGLPGAVFSRDWWVYYAFGQDFRQTTLFGGLGTAWSLGTEVSFYLFLPLYAFILGRPFLRRSLGWVIGAELAVLGLWHLPLLPKLAAAVAWARLPDSGLAATLVLFLTTSAVTVTCAALSYYIVERPILRLKERRRRRRSLPVFAAPRELQGMPVFEPE